MFYTVWVGKGAWWLNVRVFVRSFVRFVGYRLIVVFMGMKYQYQMGTVSLWSLLE